MARFKEGTIPYALMHKDWSDYTTAEIAEELHAAKASVSVAISRLRDAGYEINVKRSTRGRTRGSRRDKNKKGTIAWALMNDDWSDLTVKQIAEVLGVSYDTVWTVLYRLKQEGITIPHRKYIRSKNRDN